MYCVQSLLAVFFRDGTLTIFMWQVIGAGAGFAPVKYKGCLRVACSTVIELLLCSPAEEARVSRSRTGSRAGTAIRPPSH